MILASVWLLTTLSLGVWWFLLGLRQAKTVAELKQEIGGSVAGQSWDALNRQSRMIKMEGTFFIALLAVGGATLIWLSYRDEKRNKLIHDFFSTVTHEMKTPLASLRLQVESLEEDLSGTKVETMLQRLVGDSKRIESQMNKSLYLASLMRSEMLYLEDFSLRELLLSIQEDWSQMEIDCPRELLVRADMRALESCIRNLMENSIQHGSASRISIQCKKFSRVIKIAIQDNGSGFSGNISKLGIPFLRQSRTSGTGIGLYIVKKLITKMKGKVSFHSVGNGFGTEIELPAGGSL